MLPDPEKSVPVDVLQDFQVVASGANLAAACATLRVRNAEDLRFGTSDDQCAAQINSRLGADMLDPPLPVGAKEVESQAISIRIDVG